MHTICIIIILIQLLSIVGLIWFINRLAAFFRKHYNDKLSNVNVKSSFHDFINEIEVEAKKEGPEAVQQLEDFKKWFRDKV